MYMHISFQHREEKTRQYGRVHQLPVYHILQMNIFISCYVPVMSLNLAVSRTPFRLKKKTPHRNSLIHKHLLTRFHFIFFFSKYRIHTFAFECFVHFYINSFLKIYASQIIVDHFWSLGVVTSIDKLSITFV